MSKNNSISLGLIEHAKIGDLKGIYILFGLVFTIISVLFFLTLNFTQNKKSDQLSKKLTFREDVIALKGNLEKEILISLQSSLSFGTSKKEIYRIQTIYSLETAKNLFEEYEDISLSYIGGSEIDETIQILNQELHNYELAISKSINSDGRLPEILKGTSQSVDSAQSLVLIDEVESGIEASSSKKLEASFNIIQNQLLFIDGRIKTQIRREVEAIKSDSPAILYLIFTTLVFLQIAILIRFIIKNQKESISGLSKVLDDISRGELPDKELVDSKELELIVDTSNQLVHYLDDASQFAMKIGEGDFDYEFKPKSDKDALGNSLIEMRNRLQEVAREDKLRNWMNEGQAKIGEILRQHSNDIETLGHKVLVEVVEYLGASQGALFVVKEEGDHTFLELLSAYAYKRKKHLEKRIEIGEGLAGQVYEEGKTVYLSDIKTDHYDIQTGLGKSRPSSLLIVPLRQEERIEGIIEIASLKEIKKHQIEFVESFGESIASSLSAGKVNQTTKILLEETQVKAEQMKAQEEELRQNMEELAATQEQMERRNKEMEEIQKELIEERYLLNALLSSTNDHIYFKDLNSKFIRVSNSMVKLFNKEDESEILGKSDFDFGFEEHAKVAFEDEQNIIKTAKPLVDAIEKETWDDGRISWVSTTKNPLKDLEGKIVGTFGISRDITKNKLSELEILKRKEWFENFFKFHPVGFLVLDNSSNVNYSSKSVLSKIDKKDDDHLTFEDVFQNKSFTDFLTEIDFENSRDKEKEVILEVKSETKEKLNLLAIVGSNENEDGTLNIFLIQQ